MSIAMLFSLVIPAIADDEAKTVSFRVAAYYNDIGTLLGVKEIRGGLSDEEVNVLVDVFKPQSAQTVKFFEWTQEKYKDGKMESGRTVDLMDDAEIVILHTNDMHGSLAPSSSVIGADSVSALKQLDDAILADGGDATQGVALASQSKGEDIITIMNAAGYDVMAAGNHEFDYGLEHFDHIREMADFPIISANTYIGDSLLCADDDTNGANILIEKNGVKVGIFAITTQETKTATKPENVSGVEFKDEVQTAKVQVEELTSQGADVIIALTHMGIYENGSCTSRKLAAEMADTGLDAIIDGHSHTVLNEKVGDIVIAQTGTGGVNVGRMAINVDEDGELTINETLLSRNFFNNITPDAEVTKVIDSVNAELSETLKTEIGETKNTLWGGSIRGVIAEGRVGETNFGSLISDAMIEEAKKIVPDEYKDLPIVAIENGGGYRSSVPNGKITLGHIINALPFANTVRIKEITPAVLYAALENYVSSISAQDSETGALTASYDGSFPQIGGMRFSYNPNNSIGEKIISVSLIEGDIELNRKDTTTKIVLASNDYVIEQGAFTDIPVIAEGSGLAEVVIDYINTLTENGTKILEMPVTTGRISAIAHNADGYTYTAHITLTNADGLNDDDTIPVYVDGEIYDKAGVYNDGVLNIELMDGPHAIKLSDKQEEAYVNNYSGNGVIWGLSLKYPELEYVK